jgi:hypothetical protein
LAVDAQGELRTALERQLEAGERILWTEMPDPAEHARRELATAVFGCLWCGFMVFFTALTASAASVGGLVFSALFWLIGLYLLASPWRAHRAARRTIYGITDRRAIIVLLGREVRVRSFYPRHIGSLTLVERANGSGHVVIRHDVELDGEGGKTNVEAGFFGISDLAGVRRLLDELARKPD